MSAKVGEEPSEREWLEGLRYEDRYDDEGPNLALCDYYQGCGSCSFWCSEEPSCMTDQPREGWPALDLHWSQNASIITRRYAYRLHKWSSWQRVRRFMDRSADGSAS